MSKRNKYTRLFVKRHAIKYDSPFKSFEELNFELQTACEMNDKVRATEKLIELIKHVNTCDTIISKKAH